MLSRPSDRDLRRSYNGYGYGYGNYDRDRDRDGNFNIKSSRLKPLLQMQARIQTRF